MRVFSKNKRVSYVKKLLKYSSDKKALGAVVFLKLVAIGLSVLTPFFYNLFIDNVLTQRHVKVFLVVIIGYFSVFILQTINSVFSTRIYTKFLIDITGNIKKELFSKFFAMKTKDYNKNSVGEKKNIIENDIDVVDNMIGTHFLDYFYQYIYALILLIIMLVLNWKLTIVSIAMIPLSFLFAKVMSKKTKKISDDYRKEFGEYEGFVWGEIYNYKEVKSNNLEERMVGIFKGYWDVLGKLFVKQQILWFTNRTFVSFKDFFIVKMNLYFVGGIMIIHGSMGLATLLVFLNYYSSFFNAVSVVMDSKVQIPAQEIKMERIGKVLDYKTEPTKPLEMRGNKIEIRNVSFRYNEEMDNVLNNISLIIEENQRVSFVGRSGCGKTSLINLIYRLYEPDSGSIEVGGTDIGPLDIYDYGKKISVVLQDPCFFNNTIRYNLLLANNEATDEMLYDVLSMVGMKEFIEESKDKLDTLIGENGIKLSGGQRQRLALCRAFLKDNDIIILDEATSSLDSWNEAHIMHMLKEIGSKKTIISVSHRLSTVYKSDVIYVMEKGSLVEQGTHESLKTCCKLYQELFGNQFKEVDSYANK